MSSMAATAQPDEARRGHEMKRRQVLIALAGLVAASPRVASSRDNSARIGFLAGGAAASINSASEIRALKHGLEQTGLVEGRDYVLEPRFAAGDYEKLVELARDLIQAGARVIVTDVIGAASAARQLAPDVPVAVIDAGN